MIPTGYAWATKVIARTSIYTRLCSSRLNPTEAHPNPSKKSINSSAAPMVRPVTTQIALKLMPAARSRSRPA